MIMNDEKDNFDWLGVEKIKLEKVKDRIKINTPVHGVFVWKRNLHKTLLGAFETEDEAKKFAKEYMQRYDITGVMYLEMPAIKIYYWQYVYGKASREGRELLAEIECLMLKDQPFMMYRTAEKILIYGSRELDYLSSEEVNDEVKEQIKKCINKWKERYIY